MLFAIGWVGMAAAMLLTAAAPQTQMDIDYEGEVNVITGAPQDADASDNENKTVISLPDGGSYDRSTHTYSYHASGMAEVVKLSVASGMMVTDAVGITSDEGLSVRIYRDGAELGGDGNGTVTTPGRYAVVVSGSENDYQVASFTILSEVTGEVDSYQLPDGFYVTSVTRNGETESGINVTSVDLSGEGLYVVDYRCPTIGIDYTLRVTMDHIPPTFTLEGVQDSVARGPVTISDVADGDTLTVTRDGAEVSTAYSKTLRSTGDYVVTVTDAAGNVTTETFTIRMYLNYQSIVFILLAVAIVVGAATYMWISKKRLRVR